MILSIFKLNLGIDFSAGTRVDIDSDTKLSQPKVERTMKDMGLTQIKFKLMVVTINKQLCNLRKIYLKMKL